MEFSTRDHEALETLNGSRSKAARKKQAVRIDDLLPLLQLDPIKSLAAASDPPTQAEYDLLRKDVQALNLRLAEIAETLRAKIL